MYTIILHNHGYKCMCKGHIYLAQIKYSVAFLNYNDVKQHAPIMFCVKFM